MSLTATNPPRIALIGFGEAGSRFARAGSWAGHAHGWDMLPGRRALMQPLGVTPAPDAAAALAGAEIVLSLVTADSALPAAQDYAALLPAGALWCDMNSVAPGTKRAAAAAVEAAGGRYVDVAVMAPVGQDLAVPLLLAGAAAEAADAGLAALGFTRRQVVGAEIGRASAIKMIRSVMVKGLEALSHECAAAADAAGVFTEVMASLDASEKALSWTERVAYNRERMATHGLRRAAEMEEATRTLDALGVEPVMTRGTVLSQRRAATTDTRTEEGGSAA
ncbi:6-phosphogluconate dehydrogenase [Croceibacterium mercuriale]|uniref:6-phosphogluconate dehydrogenase n=1 Tax=Croceibacterium mercuriale TaxID=1572751 RepID=A0A0B2BWW3_9SPHN|nr:NAD(P)-dependent oxidoreductase [Croceibacterium mercuriale]KHL24482.1 6-phosphogluconate dehydrogenase [Croceibacterium mercuriale]